MATHFAILPEGIIQTLSAQLEPQLPLEGQGVRYLSLLHPRTAHPSLFLPTDTAVLELQAVSPPDGRSWFMDQEVIADGKLVIMSLIDPAFLLLPLLQLANANVFRTADDIFEEAIKNIPETLNDQQNHAKSIQASVIHLSSLACTQVALRHVCEFKALGADMVVFKYSSAKVLQYLRTKVGRLASSKALEKSRTVLRGLAKDGLMEDGKEKLLNLGRTKACCDIVAQYLPPNIKETLFASYDFAELDLYLKKTTEEAIPLKTTTNATKKGAAKAGTEKKRKAAKSSHGVEQLKKANTTGMSKLSSFFTKVDKSQS